jgi:30S ribosomal protein S31
MRGAFFFCTFTAIKTNFMGKGDKKTKKGKIFKGSFGKSRPANVKKKATLKKEINPPVEKEIKPTAVKEKEIKPVAEKEKETKPVVEKEKESKPATEKLKS